MSKSQRGIDVVSLTLGNSEKRVREVRRWAGLTQERFGKRIGYSNDRLISWLNEHPKVIEELWKHSELEHETWNSHGE